MLRVQTLEPLASSPRAQFRARTLAQCDVEVRIAITKHAGVGKLVELFGCEFANRLEHPVAVAGAAEEALVD